MMNCSNYGNITGTSYAGGMIGFENIRTTLDSSNYNYGLINNLSSSTLVGGYGNYSGGSAWLKSSELSSVNNGNINGDEGVGEILGEGAADSGDVPVAPPPPFCFGEGTQVLTLTGLKNIETIQIGDKVWSINLETNERELKEIISTRKMTANILLELQIGNEIIKATPNHRFYVQGKGWLPAEDLSIGDEIISKDNKEDCVVESMKYIYEENAINVYNLTVKDNHNYLVGENNLLVEDYEHSHYKILPSRISNISERAR